MLSAVRQTILAERGRRPNQAAEASAGRIALRSLLRYRSIWVLAAVEGCAVYTQYLIERETMS